MSAIDLQNALIARLQAMPDRPSLVYPNDPDGSAELPRIVVQVSATAQNTITIGGVTRCQTEIVARVEVEDGTLDADAGAIVTQIVNQFPVGLRLSAGYIGEAPVPRPRYADEGVYHIPVVIRGVHFF